MLNILCERNKGKLHGKYYSYDDNNIIYDRYYYINGKKNNIGREVINNIIKYSYYINDEKYEIDNYLLFMKFKNKMKKIITKKNKIINILKNERNIVNENIGIIINYIY